MKGSGEKNKDKKKMEEKEGKERREEEEYGWEKGMRE